MAAGKEIKRLRGSISVQKVASLIGVDVERLRKWEQRDADPKDSGDVAAVEAYFGRPISELSRLDNFQFVPRTLSLKSTSPVAEYRDKYILLLEKLNQEKDREIKEIHEKFTAFERMLTEAKRNQEVIYAFQMAFQETVLPLLIGQRKNILKEYGERTVAYLEKYQREGIEVHS